MPQPLPLPHWPSSRGVIVRPSFGSLRGGTPKRLLRASTSAEPGPSDQANDNLQRASQSLGRKQKILDEANQVLDSLLMDKPKPSTSKIAKAERDVAKAKRDVAEAKRDVAEAALEAFLKNNPRPLSSDVATTRAFDVNEGRFKRNLAEAEWNLSRADLTFLLRARNTPDIDLERKRKEEEIFRAAFERLVTTQSSGQSTFLYLFISLQHSFFIFIEHSYT